MAQAPFEEEQQDTFSTPDGKRMKINVPPAVMRGDLTLAQQNRHLKKMVDTIGGLYITAQEGVAEYHKMERKRAEQNATLMQTLLSTFRQASITYPESTDNNFEFKVYDIHCSISSIF